jgi:hypothetical protein
MATGQTKGRFLSVEGKLKVIREIKSVENEGGLMSGILSHKF